MIVSAPPFLAGWENFYVIVGSSAAALTGLQFVVIALVAERSSARSSSTVAAFGTPTVVHFCAALLSSSMLSAPWKTLSSVAIALGLTGLGGVLYVAIQIRHARKQQSYHPVFEDWLWHSILPLIAYGMILGTAVALPVHVTNALFFVAAATLLLVFIGIHNSWDTVTYVVLQSTPESRDAASAAPATVESDTTAK